MARVARQPWPKWSTDYRQTWRLRPVVIPLPIVLNTAATRSRQAGVRLLSQKFAISFWLAITKRRRCPGAAIGAIRALLGRKGLCGEAGTTICCRQTPSAGALTVGGNW